MINIVKTQETAGENIAVQVREAMAQNKFHMAFHQQKQRRITINHDIGQIDRTVDVQGEEAVRLWCS